MATTEDADPRETTPGYQPPANAEDHEWWWLAGKFAVAWALIDIGCATVGMPSPSTAVIAAAFLVASPPVAAVRTTVWRIAGMFVGAAAGMAGAWWGTMTSGDVPTLWFVMFGVVVGAMASHRSALTYAAVIGAVVAAQGVAEDTSIITVAWETALQLLVGCTIGLMTIYAFEKARAVWKTR